MRLIVLKNHTTHSITFFKLIKTKTRPNYLLENLIYSRLWHGKFEEDTYEAYHNKWSRGSQNRKITKTGYNAKHFKSVQDN